MAVSQPFGFACTGGLNKNLNELEILKIPGAARDLINYEVDIDGGYRRINGFLPFGYPTHTRPDGENKILGLTQYLDCVIACVNDGIYITQDGVTWTQINREFVHTGGHITDNLTLAEWNAGGTAASGQGSAPITVRTNQGQCSFVFIESTGHIIILDGVNAPYYFVLGGTIGDPLANRTFHGHTLADTGNVRVGAATGVIYRTQFITHAGNTVYIAAIGDPEDLSDTSAGSISLDQNIVAIKTFRDEVFIFCNNSIYRLINVGDANSQAVVPVTQNVGCISAYSIQEIGGDLVFLSPDGIRTLAATARIGDVELSSVSRAIQPIIVSIAKNINEYNISSEVLRSKSQYRLFYSKDSEEREDSKGIIGTFTGKGFEWSETIGIQAPALASDFDELGVEKSYHGDNKGYIYCHDVGASFSEGSITEIFSIPSTYDTPNFDFGDLGTRKTPYSVKVSVTPEGFMQPTLHVIYDYGDVNVAQPNPYLLSPASSPSVFGISQFGAGSFGGAANPMILQPIQGSGHTLNFKITTNDTAAPFAINGLYIDYYPSGRR